VIALVYCVILIFYSPSFDFDFLSTRQEIGREERPRNDLFCVEWLIKPYLNQTATSGDSGDSAGRSRRQQFR